MPFFIGREVWARGNVCPRVMARSPHALPGIVDRFALPCPLTPYASECVPVIFRPLGDQRAQRWDRADPPAFIDRLTTGRLCL